MFDLRGLGRGMAKGEEIESLLERFDWKGFEAATAEVFAENGFFVSRNFRFKTSRRYEVDIIASKQFNGTTHVLSVDCKSWGRGRDKTSGILSALSSQEERTLELKKFVSINPIAQHGLRIRKSGVYHTALVTLFDESLATREEGMENRENAEKRSAVIPIVKLNSFLNGAFLDYLG